MPGTLEACTAQGAGSRVTNSPARTTTGPISPDSMRGESFFQCFHVVKVRRSFVGRFAIVAPADEATGANQSGQAFSGDGAPRAHCTSSANCSSPIRRLTQRLVTLIVR